jgi:hypothetical protein
VIGRWLAGAKAARGWTKMVARRVTESYLGLFRTPKRGDGSRAAAVARIGTFEIRLVEMPSVNASEEMSLWVELYDRDLQFDVDSRKCGDLDEAIDAAHFLIAQARLLNSEAGEAGFAGTEPSPSDL